MRRRRYPRVAYGRDSRGYHEAQPEPPIDIGAGWSMSWAPIEVDEVSEGDKCDDDKPKRKRK